MLHNPHSFGHYLAMALALGGSIMLIMLVLVQHAAQLAQLN